MNDTTQVAGLFALVLVLAAVWTVVVATRRLKSKKRRLSEHQRDVANVKRLAYEDVTAFGEDLQQLDYDISGLPLDVGATADYERALDAYEAAKSASDSMSEPGDVRYITEIVGDGRHAIACVRARVSNEPLPTRRPPCFFDPRHGPSVTDVPYEPFAGVEREVPACALDAERIQAGADPDVRQVTVGNQRAPYWQGGRAYEPYAAGYFAAFDPLTWLFLGSFAFGNYGAGESPISDGDGAEHGVDNGHVASDDGSSDSGSFDGMGDLGF